MSRLRVNYGYDRSWKNVPVGIVAVDVVFVFVFVVADVVLKLSEVSSGWSGLFACSRE
jgi:hypothetical protein